MERLLYGAAYYEEYLPVDRLEKDVEMMKAAGINVVRIAESTWSTCEPQDGVFDFSHVERVLDAMEQAGISVIIGTPTYAVPTWMVKAYPEVLATTKQGQGIYGARQIMDITNPVYLFYAERVIRKLMEHTAHRSCVIGFQLDNETKYYGTAGKNVQQGFVKYLREKFQDDLDAMNHEFGLDYWSNRINAWEDFPDVRGTINGSLGAEFEKYQRTLVDRFLEWQAGIVGEYRREDQFVTQDFEENAAYREAKQIGREFSAYSQHLVNLKKKNSTAILVSNEALTALEWFPVNAGPDASVPVKYNDIVRWIYDTLYRMNIECDFVWPDSENIEEYDWVIVPALYAAPEALLHRLNRYVEAGGGVYGASAAAGSSSAGIL